MSAPASTVTRGTKGEYRERARMRGERGAESGWYRGRKGQDKRREEERPGGALNYSKIREECRELIVSQTRRRYFCQNYVMVAVVLLSRSVPL